MYLHELLLLVVASFACYRITQLLVMDDGPFDIILNLRIRLGRYDYDESGRAKTSLGRLFECPYCVGVWVALGLVLALYPVSLTTILYWFAVAGAQAFLESFGTRSNM